MDQNVRPSLPDLDVIIKESGWYDLWHTHVDWRGAGNQSAEARLIFLRALFGLFEQVEYRIRSWTKPAQVWVIVEEDDSSQDAVYLHTANPNQANFPYAFDGVAWGAELPAWLTEFVDPARHESGRCAYNGVVSFWVRSK